VVLPRALPIGHEGDCGAPPSVADEPPRPRQRESIAAKAKSIQTISVPRRRRRLGCSTKCAREIGEMPREAVYFEARGEAVRGQIAVARSS